MTRKTFDPILKLFHVFCILTTIAFVCWCINEYSLDHDYTETTFSTFHQTIDDIYPSITICNMNPFLERKIDSHFRNLPVIGEVYKLYEKSSASGLGEYTSKILHSYQFFLNRPKDSKRASEVWLNNMNITYDQWLQTLQLVDYDKLTTTFEDLLTDFYITFPLTDDHNKLLSYDMENGSLVANENDIEILKNDSQFSSIHGLKRIKTYVSNRGAYRKCLTIDVPLAKDVSLREIGMSFNTSSFQSEKVSPGQFFFYLTYPKQFLRAPFGSGIKLALDRAVNCYKFEIHVGYMRVFRRRNKKRAPCNPEWNRHDEKHLTHVSRKVGCNPRHWKMSSDLPFCTISEEFAEIKKELFKKNGFMPPCRSIETILKTTKGNTDWRMCLRNSFFDLKIFLDEQSHYEEVFLYPSYSLQTLVGNAGRYQYRTYVR